MAPVQVQYDATPGDVDTRIRYAWAHGEPVEPARAALLARCIELEDQIRAVCLARDTSGRFDRMVLQLYDRILGSRREGPAATLLQGLLGRLRDIADEHLNAPALRAEAFEAQAATIKAELLRRVGMTRKAERLGIFGLTLVRWLLGLAALLAGFAWAGEAGLVPRILAASRDAMALAWACCAGAGLGAWISYAQRSLNDDFASLQALASDTTSPRVRTAFVIACAIAGLVLLHLQVVTARIGILDTAQVLASLPVALATGLILGLSERALPDAIMRRAREFIGGWSGKTGAER